MSFQARVRTRALYKTRRVQLQIKRPLRVLCTSRGRGRVKLLARTRVQRMLGCLDKCSICTLRRRLQRKCFALRNKREVKISKQTDCRGRKASDYVGLLDYVDNLGVHLTRRGGKYTSMLVP